MVEVDPENIDLLVQLGDLYRTSSRFDLAIKYYNQALDISEKNMHANRGIAITYFYLNKWESAKSHFELNLVNNFNTKSTLEFLGKIEYFSNNILAAKKYFSMLLTIDSNSVEALTNLGIISQYEGDFKKAEMYFLNAVRVNEIDFIVHLNIGVYYAAVGKNDKAIKHLKKAIFLNSSNKKSYKAIANMYFRSKLFSLAEQSYLQALALDQYDSDTYFNLLILYTELADYNKAKEIVEKFNSLRLLHNQMNIAISNFYVLLEEYDKAIMYAKRQIGGNPDDIEGYVLLMGLYEYLGMEKEFEEVNTYAENNFDHLESFNNIKK
jgi:tetratricopeptide (TPR) repeat protein